MELRSQGYFSEAKPRPKTFLNNFCEAEAGAKAKKSVGYSSF